MDSNLSTDYLLYQLNHHKFTNIMLSLHINDLGLEYKNITFAYKKHFGYIHFYNPEFIKVNINNDLANIYDNVQSAVNHIKSLTFY